MKSVSTVDDANAIDLDLGALPDGVRQLQRTDQRVFAKVRHDVPSTFFAAEAMGLSTLAQTGTVRVPRVLAVHAAGIALEDLGSGQPTASDWEHAGQRLAALHLNAGERFGFLADGFCGDSPQDNTPDDDGFHFFATRRILPQLQRAFDAGRLDMTERALAERLCTRLCEYLPPDPPVLIHGDLWLGNLHACASGEIALIDAAAVHFGWAAADLAMLTMFGEPPACFFAAYENAAGGGSGWRTHAPLLNLYHMLNHLNLFGAGYANGVRQVLLRYA